MKPKDFVYIKVRLDVDLHKKLKAKAELEERSLAYLTNKAIECFVSRKESAA